jgi:tagatose-6-phosphate ketose/aldose isomerase
VATTKNEEIRMTKPMDVLGLTAAQIQAGGATFTAREIAQQPEVWPEVARLTSSDPKLKGFLTPLLENAGLRIVLAGAGTSSFVGECLAPTIARISGHRVHAIATTDIVASPESWLAAKSPTLMVHFSRSGGSPESVGTLELAEQFIERCSHLIVTCNPQGALYQSAGKVRHSHTLLLPQACNDQSFAMTSSFTGMLLAAGIALRAFSVDDSLAARLATLGRYVLSTCLPVISSLVRAQFDRVVYLGSAELKGLAREAALKMLELTDGRVVSTADSTLGFRHGPKAIVNGSTLVVVFLSNDAHTRRYDLDLVAELRRDGIAGRVIALANRPGVPEHADTLLLDGKNPAESLPDFALCLPYAVFAQALGMLRSLSLGLTPDNPNAAGTVNRVVQGVTLYPHER